MANTLPENNLSEADRLRKERVLKIVADVAHQLVTPLAIMRARAAALPKAEEADPIVREVDHLARLIGQLSAYARAESLTLHPESHFNLGFLAREVVAEQAPLAFASGRSVSCVGGDLDIWVHGDFNSAFEALSNLVHNAIHHTLENTMVTVRVREDAVVEVQDCGRGVPESERELIFERFRQGSAATPGGAGIGLAVVRDIMRAHGGAVTCEPRPGGGSVFSLHFRPDTEAHDQHLSTEQAMLASALTNGRSEIAKTAEHSSLSG